MDWYYCSYCSFYGDGTVAEGQSYIGSYHDVDQHMNVHPINGEPLVVEPDTPEWLRAIEAEILMSEEGL